MEKKQSGRGAIETLTLPASGEPDEAAVPLAVTAIEGVWPKAELTMYCTSTLVRKAGSNSCAVPDMQDAGFCHLFTSQESCGVSGHIHHINSQRFKTLGHWGVGVLIQKSCGLRPLPSSQ